MDTKEVLSAKSMLVVKENELIQRASYHLTMEEQKLLCYVISKIKPTDKVFEQYTISALDFAEVVGIDKRHAYRDFKKMVDSFDEKKQWIKVGDNNINFRVFSEAEYNEKQGSITVLLNSHLKKYLLDINRQSQYTKYELWNILSLKSKYSIRLYELFRSYSYQTEKEFDIDDLKSLLCAEQYNNFNDLKKRVIDKGINEINIYTDLKVSYDTKKAGKGGRVSRIIFKIHKKKIDDKLVAYYETVDRVNKKGKQVKGQISIFDYDMEKEIANYDNEIKIIPPQGAES